MSLGGYINDNLYKVNVDQIYAYKRNDKWKAIDGYCFVKPIDKELMGVVKYGKHEGKLVGFRPSSEYEFTIDNEKLYRVLTELGGEHIQNTLIFEKF